MRPIRTHLLDSAGGIILGVLAGCGGQSFNGTLPGGSHQPPTNPQITSLSPSMTNAGGSSFTLTVTGTNFVTGDVVNWTGNGVPLNSTFVSSTEMTAQVPASLIEVPGSVSVTVTTNPPAALQYGAATFTIEIPPLSGNSSFTVSTVNAQAKDMVWDPLSQQIYLSIPGSNGSNNGSIVALNPLNGQLGTSQSAGGDANRLAVSSDGAYLYAGIDSNSSVQRFTLPSLAPGMSIPLGSYTANGNNAPLSAIDVAVAPGNPNTIAVSRGAAAFGNTEQGGIVIYDDAVARSISVPGEGESGSAGPIDVLTWNPDAASIYGINTETPDPGYQLFVMSVHSGGVQLSQKYQSPSAIYGSHALQYDTGTGYLYSDTGYVIDPSTGNEVGSFPISSIQGGLVYDAVVPDGKLNIAYFLGQTEWTLGAQSQYILAAFDLTHFTLIGAVAIGGVGTPSISPTPLRFIRWGSNGLAALCAGTVYLISGSFVTSPAAQSTASIAQVGSHGNIQLNTKPPRPFPLQPEVARCGPMRQGTVPILLSEICN